MISVVWVELLSVFKLDEVTKKVLWYFFLFALIPLVIASSIAFYTAGRGIAEQLSSHLTYVADSKVDAVTQYMMERERNVRGFVGSPRLISVYKDLGQALVDGVESNTYSEALSIHLPLLNRYLSAYSYHQVLLVNPEGIVLYAADKDVAAGTNIFALDSGMSEVRGIVRKAGEKALAVSEVFFLKDSLSIMVSAPVYENSDYLGHLVIRLNTEAFSQVLGSWQIFGKVGEIVIFRTNDDGVHAVLSRGEGFRNISGMLSIDQMQEYSLYPSLYNEMQKEAGFYAGIDNQGRNVSYIWRSLPIIDSKIMIRADTGGTFFSLPNLLLSQLGVLLVAIAICFYFIMTLRRIVLNPLAELSRATKQIADGHYDQRVNVSGSIYVKMLGDSFNEMAEKIEQTHRDLKEQLYSLHLAEEYLAGIVENSADGIVTIDGKGNIRTFNKAAERMFGFSAEELEGNNVSMLIPGKMAKLHDGYLANSSLYESRIINTARDLYGLRKNGDIFPVELNVSRMNLPGKVTFIGILHDISDRVAAAEAIRQSEERYQNSLSFSNTGAWEWNFETNEVYWSQRVGPLLGFDESITASRERYLEALHPEDVDVASRLFGDSGAGIDAEVNFEHRVIWPDGSVHWLHQIGRCFISDDGELKRAVGIIIDITERKNLEDELRSAKDEAEKANDAKSDFLSSMSHELRTPLNAILGFGQMLQMENDGTFSESQRESINYIVDGGKHLLDLVNDILDLSKIDAGQLVVNLQAVDPKQIVDELAPSFVTMMAARSIKFEHADRENKSLEVIADYTRLRQIIINLLSNACKYNKEGGEITVSYQRIASERLRISVTDTGPGIADAKQPFLFKPFERLGAEYTSTEGSGVGLAVCKNLVELMHGEIGFVSEVGIGSTFWLELPIVKNLCEQ